MTIEEACQAQQDKYGNIAYASMLDLKIGDVRTDELRLSDDVRCPLVVVGFTTKEEMKSRNLEFGLRWNDYYAWLIDFKFYLVRAE
jgi:hypothetical protein